MKSRHEAFDDAIHATRAAIAENVVPGAGLALLRAIPTVDAEAAKLEGDERSGAQILRRALEAQLVRLQKTRESMAVWSSTRCVQEPATSDLTRHQAST